MTHNSQLTTTRVSGRRHYSPPEPSRIRECWLSELLPGTRTLTRNAQPQLEFDEPTNPRDRRIWCAGNIDLLRRADSVAVVGTRVVSADGAARARRLARELAERHIVVVSGLAKGVDTEALTAAIEAGGSVIAVIGTPLEQAYPIENASLQELIARNHLIVSQFEPGSRTFPGHFPERNRLMAALSDATAIVEAGDTSGTLHQAVECVSLGRWLFIARSVMDDPSLEWPARFRDCARVRTLSETSDILDALRA
jgi:DNA processing protein